MLSFQLESANLSIFLVQLYKKGRNCVVIVPVFRSSSVELEQRKLTKYCPHTGGIQPAPGFRIEPLQIHREDRSIYIFYACQFGILIAPVRFSGGLARLSCLPHHCPLLPKWNTPLPGEV